MNVQLKFGGTVSFGDAVGFRGTQGAQGATGTSVAGATGLQGATGATTLSGCVDVSLTDVTGGLEYDGSVWQNAVLSQLVSNNLIQGYDDQLAAFQNTEVGAPYYLNHEGVVRIRLASDFYIPVDPVARWSMTEGTGTSIADDFASPDDNSATISQVANVAWTDGRNGGSAIAIGPSKLYNNVTGSDTGLPTSATGAMTFACWFRTEEEGQSFLFHYGPNSSSGPAIGSSRFFYVSKTNLKFYAGSWGAANVNIMNTAVPASTFDGSWQHYCCTIDNKVISLYLNGEFLASETKSGLVDVIPTNFQIGAAISTITSLSYLGDIDEIAIYDYALTPAQIALLASQ